MPDLRLWTGLFLTSTIAYGIATAAAEPLHGVQRGLMSVAVSFPASLGLGLQMCRFVAARAKADADA